MKSTLSLSRFMMKNIDANFSMSVQPKSIVLKQENIAVQDFL